MSVELTWWLEQWAIEWEQLPEGKVAQVRPLERLIILDLAVPWPIPEPLMAQIDAKLAGRDDEADHCHTRRRLSLIRGGKHPEPDRQA